MDNSLFNEYGAWTEDARELGAAAEVRIRPLVQEFVAKGYSIREISHILIHEIIGMECEKVLGRAMEMRRGEKNKN
jgi:hypothetical protein